MELVAVRTLYAQFSQVCNRHFEPVISLGIGRGSSQWTTINPACPDDFWQYTLTPLKYGMDNAETLVEGLSTAIHHHCETNGTALAALMQSVVNRGNDPVIALKSGCLVDLDNARGGKDLRVSLCVTDFGFKRLSEPTVRVGRKGSTKRREYELCTNSISVACAEVGGLLVDAKENPRVDFLAAQLEGQPEFLNDLEQVKQGDVLIFFTAQDLNPQPAVPDVEEGAYCPHLGCFELLPCAQHTV